MAAIIFRDVIPKLEAGCLEILVQTIAHFGTNSLLSLLVIFAEENPLGDALGYLSATFLLILVPCRCQFATFCYDNTSDAPLAQNRHRALESSRAALKNLHFGAQPTVVNMQCSMQV